MYRFVVAFLLFANSSFAEPIVGSDHLALLSPQYGLDTVIQEPPAALGVLWRTFGTELWRLEKVLETGKVKILRIHLLNGAGLRNKQLAPYEALWGLSLSEFRKAIRLRDPGVLGIIEGESKTICEYLAKKYPHIRLLCSPVLEHNLSNEEFSIVAEVTKRAAPSAEIVNNPVREIAPADDSYHFELHGYPKLEAEILSLDGAPPKKDETPDSYAKRFPRSQIVFWWSDEMNCRQPGKFIAPRERVKCWGR